jgi:CDP-glucose 4,6-dehydratase
MQRQSAQRLDPDFWRNRRVLVTGHTGFTGGWLSLWLAHMGAKVTGYALTSQTPSLFASLELERDLISNIADLGDRTMLESAVRVARPEIVIHLAAQALVRQAHATPVETFATNVMGTVNLLETLRGVDSVQAVVAVTSDKVYLHRGLKRGYHEDDPLGGREPYSASKACAEIVVEAYRHSYFGTNGPAIATARAGNIVGGGDWALDRLVPDAVRAFEAGNALRIRNPNATRPWQHVLEAACGYLTLAERLVEQPEVNAGGWNFGPNHDDNKSVAWIADQMTKLWGHGAAWHLENRQDAPFEEQLLAVNADKAASQLGWRTRWNVEEALQRTVPWYRAQLGDRPMRRLSLDQIEEYADAA